MKKNLFIIVGMMIMLSIVSSVAFSETITINGLEYKISKPENYTDLPMVEQQAKNLYETLEDYPDVRSYVYLVNSSRTVNLKEDVTAVPPVYQAIQKYFTKSTTDYLHLDSLEQYAEYYYTTDHHWNYQGSYAGYCQIIRMLLGEDEPVLEPEETITFPVKFNGSLNNKQGADNSKEQFTAYRFSYPKMKIVINGVRQASYGNQDLYFAGKYTRMEKVNHYAKFYGGDYGMVHIETDQTDSGTLVMFSNSFSNAINLLLASHFHHLWIVDFRYYLAGLDPDFHLKDILAEDNVQVLVLGDGVFFTQNNPYQKLMKQ